jgi:hypothetical protein
MAGRDEPCSVTECTTLVGPKGAKGLCPRHYQRMLVTGSPTGSNAPSAEARFFAKVREADNCWAWTAALDDSGYGLFSDKGTIRSHIWSYEFFVGPVPDGLELDHLCHDAACLLGIECPHRRCVNPWHLEPVTDLVNTQRGRAAAKPCCPAGHRYTPESTYINPRGARVCRLCAADSRARYTARQKVAA